MKVGNKSYLKQYFPSVGVLCSLSEQHLKELGFMGHKKIFESVEIRTHGRWL